MIDKLQVCFIGVSNTHTHTHKKKKKTKKNVRIKKAPPQKKT